MESRYRQRFVWADVVFEAKFLIDPWSYVIFLLKNCFNYAIINNHLRNRLYSFFWRIRVIISSQLVTNQICDLHRRLENTDFDHSRMSASCTSQAQIRPDASQSFSTQTTQNRSESETYASSLFHRNTFTNGLRLDQGKLEEEISKNSLTHTWKRSYNLQVISYFFTSLWFFCLLLSICYMRLTKIAPVNFKFGNW